MAASADVRGGTERMLRWVVEVTHAGWAAPRHDPGPLGATGAEDGGRRTDRRAVGRATQPRGVGWAHGILGAKWRRPITKELRLRGLRPLRRTPAERLERGSGARTSSKNAASVGREDGRRRSSRSVMWNTPRRRVGWGGVSHVQENSCGGA